MSTRFHQDSDPVLRRLTDHLISCWPIDRWKNHKTIIAVSGGPDSVALLRLLHQLRQQLAVDANNHALWVAHFNHGTRPTESDADEQFVRSLAARLQLPYVCGHRQQHQSKVVSEEILRHDRYQFLLQTARECGARYVATGHHLDDQIETILFRIFRGTGISGLTGMPSFRGLDQDVVLVRPLLKASRHEIVQWLEHLGQDYRTDSSNYSSHPSRNFLRNEILPLIGQHFGEKTVRSIIRLSEQANELNVFLDRCSDSLASAFELREDSIVIDCALLVRAERILIKRLLMNQWKQLRWPLQAMSSDKWESLCDVVLRSAKGRDDKTCWPGNVVATSVDGRLCLQRGDSG